MSHKARFLAGVTIVQALTFAPAAIAQITSGQAAPNDSFAAPAPDAGPTETTSGIEDIVVTARRSEENLQDVPLSITAFSSRSLAERGVRDIYDLQQATPALSVGGTQSEGRASGSYVIHGQKAAADDAPPGVVTYLNDVPVLGGEISRALFDLESVQVLKGPQGTLFGRNTNGGAILFNTVAPRSDFGGYVTARYGNYNDRYLEGAINLPLSESLAIRAAGNIERRNGFTKNDAGPDIDNLHYQNARFSIRFKPNDVLENTLVFNYTRIHERGPGFILVNLAPCTASSAPTTASCLLTPALGFDPSISQQFADQQARGIRNVSQSQPSTTDIKAFGVSNTTTLSLGNVTVKNIFGYHDYKFWGNVDDDGADYTILSVAYNRHTKTLTNELQVQGSFLDDRLKVIVGGFYLSSEEDPFCGERTGFCATNNGEIFLPLFFNNLQFEHKNDLSRALFAQASFALTPTLTATAGYRHTWDKTRLTDQHFRDFPAGNILGVPAGARLCSLLASPLAAGVTVDPVNCVRQARANFSAGNYIATLDWKPAEGVLLYGAFRHGYKSGGLNSTSDFSGSQFIFAPEKLNDVELGLKVQRRIGDVDVRFNISGFHDWYDGLQLTSVIVDPVAGPQSLTQTVGKARLWGGEMELVVVPVRNLSLGVTFNYFDGKYISGTVIDSNSVSRNLSGVRYNSQPKFTYTLNASYGIEFGDSKITPSVFYSWRKGYYINFEETPGRFIESYGLLNARIDYSNVANTKIDLAVFAKNITNKTYTLNPFLGGPAFGFDSRFFGEPRMYGVEASYRF